MAAAEEKDVPMEDVTEVDEDELLGKNGEELDESMKDIKLEANDNTEGDSAGADGEEKKKEEKKEDDDDDGGAASDTEFSAEDDRAGTAGEASWKWHIEMYPLAPEDAQLENFLKMMNVAAQCHTIFKTNENGEKRGEAHFYTQDAQAAKTLLRTICCRKFTNFRPFIYLYKKKEDDNEEYESAVLRLDLIESAKMRWDRQRKNKGTVGSWGEPASRVAKVSNVPLGTSKEFLNVLFARAFHIKRESDQSEAEEAKKAKEAMENDEPKEENSTAVKKEEKEEKEKEDEDKEENNEEEEEELVGEFNGNLTIDCCSRTSLKGFLLGYRKVIIGDNTLEIKPLSTEEIDVNALRKEVRKKRRHESIHGKEWTPVTPADRASYREDDMGGRSFNRGRGRGGPRGGRGDYRGGGRGGVMTGRQKMNEKSMRRGGFSRDGGPRGGRGGGFRDEMRYLQSQLQMNTFELQRQIASLRGRDRGYGGGFRDFPPDPYDLPPVGPGGYGYGPGPIDDWGYGGGRGGGPRYGGGGGGGRGKPQRSKRR